MHNGTNNDHRQARPQFEQMCTLDELATIAGPHGAVLVDAEGRTRLVDRLHPERELSPQRSYLDRIRGARPL